MYKCNNEARSRNYCCRVKEISITYPECVSLALVIQHVKRMCCITFSTVACLAPPNFYTLFNKRQDFLGKGNVHKICVLIFSTTFV